MMKRSLRCVVVDDESHAIKILQKYIAKMPTLELVATCADGYEALKVVDGAIDLLFLDINMPDLDGLELLSALPQKPEVIFTTAHPNYAVEGFNVKAIDFLLKPFSFERFAQAVHRVAEKVMAQTAEGQPAEPPYLFLKVDKKMVKADTDSIRYLQAWGDYVKVFTTNGVFLTNETLKNLLGKLPDEGFCRIHKSYVVALGHIDYLEGNRIYAGKDVLPVGVSFKDQLLKKLKSV